MQFFQCWIIPLNFQFIYSTIENILGKCFKFVISQVLSDLKLDYLCVIILSDYWYTIQKVISTEFSNEQKSILFLYFKPRMNIYNIFKGLT